MTLTGFGKNEDIEFKVNGTSISGIQTDENGAASYPPATPYTAGVYNITATGKSSYYYATATFTVAAAAASINGAPATARPGAAIAFTLSGFTASESIKLYLITPKLPPAALLRSP
jgi:hypothetical protein